LVNEKNDAVKEKIKHSIKKNHQTLRIYLKGFTLKKKKKKIERCGQELAMWV
jgi:hypothetical protein